MASDQDQVSTQQNFSRQIGLVAAALQNVAPAATTTASPKAWGFNNIGTSAAVAVLAASTTRHGLIWHVPHSTATILIYPNNISAAPGTVNTGGGIIIVGFGTFEMPASQFPNCNSSWSAIAISGSSLPLTVWEFF